MIKAGTNPIPMARVIYNGVEQFEVKYNGTVIHVRKKHTFKQNGNVSYGTVTKYGTWGFYLTAPPVNNDMGSYSTFKGWSTTYNSLPPAMTSFPVAIKKTALTFYGVWEVDFTNDTYGDIDQVFYEQPSNHRVVYGIDNDSLHDIYARPYNAFFNEGGNIRNDITWDIGSSWVLVRAGSRKTWVSTNFSSYYKGASVRFEIRDHWFTNNIHVLGTKLETMEVGDMSSSTTTT